MARRTTLLDPPAPDRRVRTRRSARRWAAPLLVAAVGAVGCSSGSPSGPPPEEAARLLTAGYALDASHEQCFRQAFEDDRRATAALAVGGSAPEDEQAALRAVLEGCISPDDLADVVVGSVSGGIPGTGDDQQQCLRQATLDLTAEQRATLMLGLALSGDASPDELDVRLGEVTSELFRACSIGIDAGAGTTTTTDPTPTSAP